MTMQHQLRIEVVMLCFGLCSAYRHDRPHRAADGDVQSPKILQQDAHDDAAFVIDHDHHHDDAAFAAHAEAPAVVQSFSDMMHAQRVRHIKQHLEALNAKAESRQRTLVRAIELFQRARAETVAMQMKDDNDHDDEGHYGRAKQRRTELLQSALAEEKALLQELSIKMTVKEEQVGSLFICVAVVVVHHVFVNICCGVCVRVVP